MNARTGLEKVKEAHGGGLPKTKAQSNEGLGDDKGGS